MTHKLDPVFFSDLSRCDPSDVCRRALCTYEAARRCYVVEVWDDLWEVAPDRQTIVSIGSYHRSLSVEMRLAVLTYLVGAKDIDLSDEWVSEKDLRGGEMFFRGPHSIPVHLIARRFGYDLNGFHIASQTCKGTATELADASYVFKVLPRIPVQVLLWRADQEFEAQASCLFDRTVSSHIPLDVIFGIGMEVCTRLASWPPHGIEGHRGSGCSGLGNS